MAPPPALFGAGVWGRSGGEEILGRFSSRYLDQQKKHWVYLVVVHGICVTIRLPSVPTSLSGPDFPALRRDVGRVWTTPGSISMGATLSRRSSPWVLGIPNTTIVIILWRGRMSCPAPASFVMHALCMQKKNSKRPRLEGEEDGGGGVLGIGGINRINQDILRYIKRHVIP